MKKFSCLLFGIGTLVCGYPQTRPTPHEWHARLMVLDDIGRPVARAEVAISYAVDSVPDRPFAAERITGFTDTNGIFTASHTDRSVYLGFHAQKSRYYPILLRHELGFSTEGGHAKWNPAPVLVLKRIINPIPMYARWVKSDPPILNQPVGYDLITGDWVSPHGKGRSTDVIVLAERGQAADVGYRLKLTFPQKGDGIQEFSLWPFKDNEGSALRSPHQAPMDGYQAELTRDQTQAGQANGIDYEPKRNYFFRVRTVLDENGNVKSALYGKIYGDFMKFRYYLNPTSNSRNVEFDPTKNLFTGLKASERVTAP